MEENITQENAFSAHQSNPLVVSPDMTLNLSETARWSKFFAILGFIFCGLIALVALGLFVGGEAFNTNPMYAQFGAVKNVIAVLYLVLGLLYYFPSRYLYNFASNLKFALSNHDQEALNYAMANQKSVYRFWGILTIILIALYIIIIVFAIGFAGFFASYR